MTTKNNKEIRENIIDLIWEWRVFCGALNPVTRKRAEKMADQILSLIPEEGEVIFEGMVNLIDLDDLFLAVFKEKVEKYQGKEIQIIIREVKD